MRIEMLNIQMHMTYVIFYHRLALVGSQQLCDKVITT